MDWYFGGSLTPGSFDQLVEHLGETISSGRRRYLVGHHNLHSLYRVRNDLTVRSFYQRCDHCYIDGVPVCWILSAAGMATPMSHRTTLMDTFGALLASAEQRGWSVYYLGSSAEVVAVARQRFSARYPALQIELHEGYFEDDEDILSRINDIQPDLLFVGMGMPLQEQWILRHLDRLEVGMVTTSGATLDYYAGAQSRPPAWMSRFGLAWIYRLAHHPLRLGRRYLVEPWGLLLPTLKLIFTRGR